MKKLVLLMAALLAGMALTAATSANAATWPASCKTMACVNKHLNALHKSSKAQAAKLKTLNTVVNDLVNTNPPTNNTLQGEIDQLKQVDQDQQSALNNVAQDLQGQINTIWQQPVFNGCWQTMDVSRFTSTSNESANVDNNEWTRLRNNPTGDGVLDVSHSNQSASGFVYRLVFDACNSG